MPIREFKCNVCQHKWEEILDDDECTEGCKACGALDVTKLFSLSAFILKGEGWFSNYRRLKTLEHDPYDLVDNDGDPVDKKGRKL